MNYLDVIQVGVAIAGLLLTVVVTVSLAIFSYIVKRRDKEIDKLIEKQDITESKTAEQDVKITYLQSEVRLLEGMKVDLREIRDAILKMTVSLTKLESK